MFKLSIFIDLGCFPFSGKWQEINVGEGVEEKGTLVYGWECKLMQTL